VGVEYIVKRNRGWGFELCRGVRSSCERRFLAGQANNLVQKYCLLNAKLLDPLPLSHGKGIEDRGRRIEDGRWTIEDLGYGMRS
jgi:hypothetical protein